MSVGEGLARPLRKISPAPQRGPGALITLLSITLLAVSALAAAELVPTALVSAAQADGDPASDTLLGENVYYPYSPIVSPALQKTLNAQTAAAKKSGFPLKVALIGAPTDLGVIPDLFGKPQRYADFLDQEISYQTKQPLLVVMPSGYGVTGLPPAAVSAAAKLPKPTGHGSDAIARAATLAVPRLAEAAGHPLEGYSGGSGSSSTTIIVVVLAVVAVLVAAALALTTLRRRRGTSPA